VPLSPLQGRRRFRIGRRIFNRTRLTHSVEVAQLPAISQNLLFEILSWSVVSARVGRSCGAGARSWASPFRHAGRADARFLYAESKPPRARLTGRKSSGSKGMRRLFISWWRRAEVTLYPGLNLTGRLLQGYEVSVRTGSQNDKFILLDLAFARWALQKGCRFSRCREGRVPASGPRLLARSWIGLTIVLTRSMMLRMRCSAVPAPGDLEQARLRAGFLHTMKRQGRKKRRPS